MYIKLLSSMVFLCVLLSGCGGGGGGGGGGAAPVAAATPATPAAPVTAPEPTGGFTLLLGDNPLDGIEAVNIDIEDVILIGEDGQVDLDVGDIGVINLLDLRNITEMVAFEEVPVGVYSKIRLLINSLEIIEEDNPSPIAAKLPANGKIDLNPQTTFQISEGENLVLQIDFDLHRSIKLGQTGKGDYRFRPVVFIDVIENLRLTRLFGSVQEDDDGEPDATGNPSDLDLCTGMNMDPCFDVQLADGALLLRPDGSTVAYEDLVLPEDGNVFGHFFIGTDGDQFFRAVAIAFGAEDSVVAIDGSVESTVVDDAFDLLEEDEVDPTSVQILAGAVLLDERGAPLAVEIGPGQDAEAWAQTAVLADAEENEYPSFLIQVREDDFESSVEGTLIDLVDDTLTVSNDDGQFCVKVSDDTEIQLLSDYDGDAEVDIISLTAVGDLISVGVVIEAFGDQVGDCLEATLVSAEVD